MAALTQKQTDRLNDLRRKTELSADEKQELNVLQKVESGEDTDAVNEGGDNNPQTFEEADNPNEQSLTEKEREQRDAAEGKAS